MMDKKQQNLAGVLALHTEEATGFQYRAVSQIALVQQPVVSQPVYEVLGYTEPGHDIRGKRRGESGAPDGTFCFPNKKRTNRIFP
jgi:hypothetical protein